MACEMAEGAPLATRGVLLPDSSFQPQAAERSCRGTRPHPHPHPRRRSTPPELLRGDRAGDAGDSGARPRRGPARLAKLRNKGANLQSCDGICEGWAVPRALPPCRPPRTASAPARARKRPSASWRAGGQGGGGGGGGLSLRPPPPAASTTTSTTRHHLRGAGRVHGQGHGAGEDRGALLWPLPEHVDVARVDPKNILDPALTSGSGAVDVFVHANLVEQDEEAPTGRTRWTSSASSSRSTCAGTRPTADSRSTSRGGSASAR